MFLYYLLYLPWCPSCSSDHLDLVVYLMMRTQSARASRRTSLHLTSCCSCSSTIHLYFHLSSFGFFPLCLLPFSFGYLPGQVFMLYPFSLACFCQWDTCCCILLCRIAEFSCLLNLLTTLNHSVPALFHHIFTPTLHFHSFSSFTFVSSLLGPGSSLRATRAHIHSTSRTTGVIHRSTVSVYSGTFTLPANR